MAFPRLCALAEVTWSPPASRNWEDFTRRLQTQFQRFDQLGVNYRKGTPEPHRRVSEAQDRALLRVEAAAARRCHAVQIGSLSRAMNCLMAGDSTLVLR